TPKIVLLSVSIRRMSKGSGPSAMAPPARVDRTQRLRGSQQWNLPDECLADDITGSPPQGVRRIFYSGTPMQLEAGFPRFDGRVRATPPPDVCACNITLILRSRIMIKQHLMLALIGTALVATPALAQS